MRADRALLVLLISGILGFRVGMAGFPTWAIPVESAQVVAGLVKYPPDNPFYIYHTRIWTIVIQLCAVMLRAGVSEMTLSRLLSGTLGMASFQALAMFAYAIGGDAVLAIGSALVVFFSRITDMGVIYPVMLLDTHHTYGALGLSALVLVTTLFGVGYYRAGAFLLGLAPAIHPSLAVWVGLALAMGCAWDFRRLERDLRPALKYFLAGGAVAAVSLAIQLAFIAHSLPVDSQVSARYFHAFVNIWDEHRRPVQMAQAGVTANWAALGLAVLWLKLFGNDFSPAARWLLRTVAAAAVVGLAAALFTWIPAERQPVLLSMLMPARLLNYNVMMIGPLIVGLLCACRNRAAGLFVLAAFLAALLLNERSMFNPHPLDPTRVLEVAALATALLAIVMAVMPSVVPTFRSAQSTGAAAITALVLCVQIVLVATFLTLRISRPVSFYRDRTSDPFFGKVAAETQGVLLTGGWYQLVQLYTRRPVLIDGGGLDSMTYAPDTGPATAKILRDVYDIDFFNPPPWANGSALLPHDYVKSVWARFSPEKWREIRQVYGVTDILTRTDYSLNLPVVAEEGSFRLYRIPER